MQILHSVSYRADDESCLILTGKTSEAKMLVLLYHIEKDETSNIVAPGEFYKPSLYSRQIVFANPFKQELEAESCSTLPLKPNHLRSQSGAL